MRYDEFKMCQISDGLTQAVTCASAAVYDKANGIVFVSYSKALVRVMI